MNPKNTDVDTPEATTHIGLCAGYGGIELGLKQVIPDLRTVALCEIEAFACANLVAKMEAGLVDAAPIWTDLKTFPWAEFRGKVDILTAGYPCQPFSAAGKRAGKDDPRHLWPWIADGIRLLQPRCCLFENVEGHITLGLSTVISDLEELGYKVSWGIFSASEVGAPHQRKRVFILAYSASIGRREDHWIGNTRLAHQADAIWPSRPGEPQHEWEPQRVVANAASAGLRKRQEDKRNAELAWSSQTMGNAAQLFSNGGNHYDGINERFEKVSKPRDPSGEGMGDATFLRTQGQWPKQQAAGTMQSSCAGAISDQSNWQTEPTLGRDTDGPAHRMDDAQLYVTCDNRTDELRLLGNGVMPATAERAFRVLMERL